MTMLSQGWANVLGALALALGCGACTQLHGGPQDGTETGNPPIASPTLNAARVALVISADQVRVTGQAGAATPAGATVEVASALTSEVFRGPVAADGSFDVSVSGSKLDTYEVRVVADGEESSNSVYVAPGAAAVTSASDGGALSCDQRSELARQQLEAVLTRPLQVGEMVRTSCRIDSDCTTVSPISTCNDSCSTYAISKVGTAELEAAVDAVEAGLCKNFSADGCKVVAQPCPGPTAEVACVGSWLCQLVERSGPDCTDRAVCANGTRQIWPGVCIASIAPPDSPGAGVSLVCVENDRGEVGLLSMRSDQAVTNKGWFNSAHGLFPDALSPDGRAKCEAQRAALGAEERRGFQDCISGTP